MFNNSQIWGNTFDLQSVIPSDNFVQFLTEVNTAHNYDLNNLVTPLDVDKFDQLLQESNYDERESSFLIDGFRNGFDICHGTALPHLCAPVVLLRPSGLSYTHL